MLMQKDKKYQALATIYCNPKISLKTRLNKSLMESTRKTEHKNQTLESPQPQTSLDVKARTQKRPKSSQNFLFKPANAKSHLRPSSKPKYEEHLMLMPSVEAEFSPLVNSQKISMYPRRPARTQKKTHTRTGRNTGGDKLSDVIVSVKKK